MRISDWSSDVCSSDLQGLGVTLRRSNAGRRDRTFELVSEAKRSNYTSFEALTGRVGVRWSYDSTPLWQKKLTYADVAELIATSENDYDFARVQRVRNFYTILGRRSEEHTSELQSLMPISYAVSILQTTIHPHQHH